MNDQNNRDADKKVQRDMALAHQYRGNRGRYAQHAADLTKQWMKSPEARQLKKFQRINSVMQTFFPENILQYIKPIKLSNGCLTITAPDSVIISELRNHYHHQFQEALVAAGTGVSKIIYRRGG